MQEATIEAMKSDIEEGNFCDTLLEKIDNDERVRIILLLLALFFLT